MHHIPPGVQGQQAQALYAGPVLVLDIASKDLPGIARKQKGRAVLDQLRQPVPAGPQLFQNLLLAAFAHGAQVDQRGLFCKKQRVAGERRVHPLNLRQALFQVVDVVQIPEQITNLREQNLNFHGAFPF